MTTMPPMSTRTAKQARELAKELMHLDEYAREAAIEQKLKLRPGTAEILLTNAN
jgi:hypothetical protein